MDLQNFIEQLSPEEAPFRLRNPNPNPNPSLRPLHSTAFKRETSRQRRERKRQEKEEQLLLLQLEQLPPLTEKPRPPKPTVSDVEWPCPPPEPEPVTAGWGQWEPAAATTPPPPPPLPLSAEEIARIAAVQVQKKALQACREFLSERDLSDDEGEDDPIEFFVGLFEKDEQLRGYYERNWANGKFCCLVCEGMGKGGRMFVNAAGLVQHSGAVGRKKGIAEHRALGGAACLVLGWDEGKVPRSDLGVGGEVVESSDTDAHHVDDTQEKDCMSDRHVPARTVNADVMDCA